jgi:hypothetical protein
VADVADVADVAIDGRDAQAIAWTDVGGGAWKRPDAVIRLRQWGTRASCDLPPPTSAGVWTIGAAPSCWLELADLQRTVSRQHARVVFDGSGWRIAALDSEYELRVDGARCGEAVLEPGQELGIGGITLIAESARLIALRGFLERILGWGDDRMADVDHALWSLRLAASRRSPLVVCGDGDLVQIARGLHARTLGEDRPFVVCDPRRHTTGESARSAENYRAGMPALRAAAGGSLCVWARRLPRDFEEVRRALRDPAARTQLVVCARDPSEVGLLVATAIVVPALATRAEEMDRIIDEYVADAVATRGGQTGSFTASDRAWVLAHAAHALPEIEKATRRLLAIREAGNLNRAAARLGLARVSLKKWIGRRSLPSPIDA